MTALTIGPGTEFSAALPMTFALSCCSRQHVLSIFFLISCFVLTPSDVGMKIEPIQEQRPKPPPILMRWNEYIELSLVLSGLRNLRKCAPIPSSGSSFIEVVRVEEHGFFRNVSKSFLIARTRLYESLIKSAIKTSSEPLPIDGHKAPRGPVFQNLTDVSHS
ncbi:hypothetical protein ACFE04_019705 [Oxalis oulophora]